MWKYALGQEIEDSLTGLKGRVDARIEQISGSLRYTIQPPAKDNVVPDSHWVDAVQVIGEPLESEETTDFEFELGTRARCKITNFEGMIVARCEYLNKCRAYMLQPPVDEKGKKQEAHMVYENTLELVVSAKKVEEPVKPRKTGGARSVGKASRPDW